jgi:hypothetical protein
MNGTVITRYSGKGGNVIIPNNVTGIDGGGFAETLITSVTIPNSVTSIGMSAFAMCPNLTAINVDSDNANYSSADGVLYNKNKTVLIQCPAGKTGALTIPSSVTSIGISAFFYCAKLTGVTIPNSVTKIEWGVFRECTGLTSVTIPNGVIKIEDNTFSGCTRLVSVSIPNSVTSIGASAFNGCSSLKNVTLPNITSISEETFTGCKSLTSITIPNSVTKIERGAFCNTGLTNVTIPNRVARIEGIERMGSNYGGVFENCSILASVTIGSVVTYIGAAAFEGCRSLASVTFLGRGANFDFLDGNVGRGSFGYIGDLYDKYSKEGAGTYKTTPVGSGPRGTVWTKQ